MKVIDSNIVIKCFDNKKALPEGELVAPDDLRDEYAVTVEQHRQEIPGVKLASKISGYNEAYYLQRYAYYLNSYKEVYFVQMRGFADVSILALVSCLVTNFGKQGQQAILDFGIDTPDKITVITDDKVLTQSLKKEFDGQIDILGYNDF